MGILNAIIFIKNLAKDLVDLFSKAKGKKIPKSNRIVNIINSL